MKNYDKLIDAIKNLGFPIVVSIGCLFFIVDTQEKIREDYSIREDRFYKQLDGYKETLDNFNKTLQSIDKRLEVLEHVKK